MAKPTRMFWWSPSKSYPLAHSEVTTNPMVWARLFMRSGRLLRNFGDELSPLAWTAATGRPVRWTTPAAAEVVGIGSILELVSPHVNSLAIWGTGSRFPHDESTALLRATSVLAVRGPETAKFFGAYPDCFGDPGVLAPEIEPVKAGQRRRGTVFLPHFRVWSTREGRRCISFARSKGYTIVTPADKPKVVLRKIAASDSVITSSLHGLIVADAYGRAVKAVRLNDHESDHKYKDYLLGQEASTLRHPVKEVEDLHISAGEMEMLKARAESASARAAQQANLLSLAASTF